MNNLRTTVSVLLVSSPLGFVMPASATSAAPDRPVDFCDFSSMNSVADDDLEAAAEEVMDLLPRWYKDVARENLILVNVYDGPSDTTATSMIIVHVDEDYQTTVIRPEDMTDLMELFLSLTVDANCNALNVIMSSDDKGDQIVQMIWEGHITYDGYGPGADAAVVYSKSLLTGAYVMQNGQTGNSGDFFQGTMAPVTKTYEELQSTYERFSEPFQDEIRRPGGN